MSLWVDKYRPKDLSKLDYHKEQAENLKKLTQRGDFPHLLVYGPSGAGKKTRIMCILKDLYGPGVERLRMEQLNFTTPSKKKLEIMTVSSNYHIEINPSDVGIYDRIVVMDLIKNVAQTQQLDVNGQREFKVIVLTDVDDLSKDAQHALRRTMEKYIANCRLILSANSTSRLTPAIRSRCLGIRVSAPTEPEIVTILQSVCKKEGLSLPIELAQRIAEKSNRNLRRAILMCEACKVEQYPFSSNQNIAEPDWLLFIRAIARKISQEQSINTLASVRVSELVKNCDIILKAEIISQAALFEHRLQHGNKAIFHLEAFVAKYMYLYKKFLEDTLGEAF
ncbi:hypothetical protein FQR65_LT09211 [Abscondita terminalis]|nr:hypothetical protein FQR65_LT09211 [Abscondita terminalis]